MTYSFKEGFYPISWGDFCVPFTISKLLDYTLRGLEPKCNLRSNFYHIIIVIIKFA